MQVLTSSMIMILRRLLIDPIDAVVLRRLLLFCWCCCCWLLFVVCHIGEYVRNVLHRYWRVDFSLCVVNKMNQRGRLNERRKSYKSVCGGVLNRYWHDRQKGREKTHQSRCHGGAIVVELDRQTLGKCLRQKGRRPHLVPGHTTRGVGEQGSVWKWVEKVVQLKAGMHAVQDTSNKKQQKPVVRAGFLFT